MHVGLGTRLACAHDNQWNVQFKAANFPNVPPGARSPAAPFQGGEVAQGRQAGGRRGLGGATFTTFTARTHADTDAHIHRAEGQGCNTPCLPQSHTKSIKVPRRSALTSVAAGSTEGFVNKPRGK